MILVMAISFIFFDINLKYNIIQRFSRGKHNVEFTGFALFAKSSGMTG
jgi:hypothetical protein